jgi:hypothetical protein
VCVKARDGRADKGGIPGSAGWTEVDENGTKANVTKKRRNMVVTMGSWGPKRTGQTVYINIYIECLEYLGYKEWNVRKESERKKITK